MPHSTPPTNPADHRRKRLRQWIDMHFGGSQIAFIASTNDGEKQMNQGELSALLRDKSFGEKRARSLELQSNMPAMYLDSEEAATVGAKVQEITGAHTAGAPVPIGKAIVWPFKNVSYQRLADLRRQLGPKAGNDALRDIDKHLEIVVLKWESEILASKSAAR